jgi:RNA polymerase sigma factor (sigma-70 family)
VAVNPGDGELLRDEVERGQRLDRELAERLGRPVGPRATPGALALGRLGTQEAPDAAAEHALVAAAQAGDAAARARLVEAFLPRIGAVARTYRHGRVQRTELLQEGVVGLLRALERYDPALGTPFWAYAAWWVRQAMQQLVAELTRPVVLSDRALRHLARVRDAQHDALRRTGREPSRDELAERTGLSAGQLDDLLATERPARSLDEPVPGDEGTVGSFGDLLVDPLAEDAYERVLDELEATALRDLLLGLSDRERDVLRARFGLDAPEQSLRDIGARLGLSAERVRQIERRALGKLAGAASA